MEYDFDSGYETNVNIKVVGVGGGGNNAVKRMIETNIRGVEFITINTDKQALAESCAAKKLVIGQNTTGGKGAGANPNIGKQSAEESKEEIKNHIAGADMLFITAGMGGGTGTGAAPIVAQLARDMGILTVGIVTTPFEFEGKRRMNQAKEGIKELEAAVDSLIVIPNERLKDLDERDDLRADKAFEMADDVLRKAVQSVSDVINFPGFVNLDFADVTTIMRNAGPAHMGVGYATGDNKAKIAATMAINSNLLSTRILGATGVLISITASPDISLSEITLASKMVQEEAHPDANIIWGTSFDATMKNAIRITIIATGFPSREEEKKEAEIINNNRIIVTDTSADIDPAPIKTTVITRASDNVPEKITVIESTPVQEILTEPISYSEPEPVVEIVNKAEVPTNAAKDAVNNYEKIFNFIKRERKNK